MPILNLQSVSLFETSIFTNFQVIRNSIAFVAIIWKIKKKRIGDENNNFITHPCIKNKFIDKINISRLIIRPNYWCCYLKSLIIFFKNLKI